MRLKKFLAVLFMGVIATAASFSGKYNICLCSFAKYENASNYVNTLLLDGFSVTIEPSLVDGQLYYRILLAESFDTMIEAEKTRADFAEEFGRNDIWIMNAKLSRKNIPSETAECSRTVIADSNDNSAELMAELENSKAEAERAKTEVMESKQNIENLKAEISNLKVKLSEMDDLRATLEAARIEIERLRMEDSAEESAASAAETVKAPAEEVAVSEEPVSMLIQPNTAAEIVADLPEEIVYDMAKVLNGTLVENSIPSEFDFKGKSSFPTTITENVQELVNLFPMNSNFKMEGISLFDLDNIRDGELGISTEAVNSIVTPYDFEFIEKDEIHAASLGRYEDKDFGAKLSVLMVKMDNTNLSSFLDGETAFDKVYEVEFKLQPKISLGLPEEKFNCVMVKSKKDSGEYRLFGENESKTLFLSIQADDLGKDWINRFIVGQNSAGENVLDSAVVKKSLLSLPDEDEKLDRRFLSFELSLSDSTVERKEGFRNTEHWNANAAFDQEDTVLRIGFFDID